VLSRRALLSSVLAAGTVGVAAACAPTATPTPTPTPSPTSTATPTPTVPVLRGADLSFTTQMEAIGVGYRDGGVAAPVETLLAARGATLVRLRAWVDPPAGYSDLTDALALGRRAHAAGCAVLLDLHYSDFWADQRTQTTPVAWQGLDLGGLTERVRGYTREAVAAFAAQGTPLAMIQIGNEVTSGMLWPHGQVYGRGPEQWDGFVALLRAGLRGAREGATGPLETMIHIDRGGDGGGARYFYDAITARGIDFDLVGLSYYPFWHGSLEDLRGTVTDLAVRFGKDVVVVETSYPWGLPQDGVEYYAARESELPDVRRFPATTAGQAAYYEALRAMLAAVPDGRGRGFVVWEPGWLPGVGWDVGEANPYANLTMFDWTGAGLPSLAAFRAGA
jgi:arabinogalactan endo-1,4-beta-galactosidase